MTALYGTSRLPKITFTSDDRIKRSSRSWTVYFLCILLFCGLVGFLAYRQPPGPALLGWLVFLLGAGAIIYQPRNGVYLMVFWGLVGDSLLIPWFPFVKGLSATESLLYLNRSLIFNPLEIYLVITFLSWLVRGIAVRKITFHKGVMFWPILLFLSFTVFGLVYGLSRGGISNIALWESRPIFHMILVFFLATNLIQEREHIKILIWVAMVAVFIMGLLGDIYYLFVLKMDLSGIEAITEHGSAIHMNTLFLFTITTFFYKVSPKKRLILVLMSLVVILAYFADQRRAAFVSLIVAVGLFVLILFIENRKVFWLIVPPLAVIGVIYMAAFWNSTSKLALPVEAMKSIIAPNQVSTRDQSSNQYRLIENVNTTFTIHSRPLTGVGFGQKFYVLVPLPDISFFTWWEYITHNSVLWIWMKMGVGGFFSMIFVVGLALVTGMRAFLRMPPGEYRAIALTATFYVLMHYVYAYVDMSWDSRSMIYIGAMIGLINCIELVVAKPMQTRFKRWPWQPEPKAEAAILPELD
jgi:hypothetical protein